MFVYFLACIILYSTVNIIMIEIIHVVTDRESMTFHVLVN